MGLFDKFSDPYSTMGPMDPGMSMPTGINPNAPAPTMSAPPVKPNFFGQGGTGGTILGILGDAISAGSGGQQSFLPMLMQQKQQQTALERGEQQYQRRRADENTDWMQREQWQRQHPATPQPTEFERLAAAAYGQGTPEYLKAVQGRVQSQANPLMAVQGFDANGNPTITMMPRGGGMPSTPPQAPVGKLRPIGGAASQGAGGFR